MRSLTLAIAALLAASVVSAGAASEDAADEAIRSENANRTRTIGRSEQALKSAGAVKPAAAGRFKPIEEIRLPGSPPTTDLPLDESTDLFSSPQTANQQVLGRTSWAQREYHWTAPEFHHFPLYFDDVPLERYGQSAKAVHQPFVSAAHFYRDAALLPYSIIANPVHRRVSPLGYFRPGSPTPPVRQTTLTPRFAW